jgi:hypothetical protein
MRSGQASELVADEHKRYMLYVDALASMPPGSEAAVIEIVRSDSDRVMSQAATVDYLDRTAQGLATVSEYVDWLNRNRSSFEGMEFAERRADEWRLLKELEENRSIDLAELKEASDWLQRRAVEKANSAAALQLAF